MAIADEYKKMIVKYASIIVQKPYHLTEAAKALVDWVEQRGEGRVTDFLDVSACEAVVRHHAPGVAG
eukprot:10642778-Lingulodinium_polyedra.AAC.1